VTSLDEAYSKLEFLSEGIMPDLLGAVINLAMENRSVSFKYAFADLTNLLLDNRATFNSRVIDAVEAIFIAQQRSAFEERHRQ
jgi:hypothetical protein